MQLSADTKHSPNNLSSRCFAPLSLAAWSEQNNVRFESTTAVAAWASPDEGPRQSGGVVMYAPNRILAPVYSMTEYDDFSPDQPLRANEILSEDTASMPHRLSGGTSTGHNSCK